MHVQVMAKPAGPSCNLNCSYCFYTEKKSLYGGDAVQRMAHEVLESFIQQAVEARHGTEYHFAWQGGEPTLLGTDYFEKIVDLQKRYAGGAKVHNTIQTNGTLLTDSWCSFLKENEFLVGLSVDGPSPLHDQYRRTTQGRSSFAEVLRALELLKKHQVPFNTLTVVNDSNSRSPLEVYNFLKEIGDGHMQFIPAVERYADPAARKLGLKLAMPSAKSFDSDSPRLMPWSVQPELLANFYLTIFHEWLQNDVGKIFVQFFDVALGNWLGAGSGLCQFAPVCGLSGALEHNGDLYSCDHYVYPKYKLGNIMETPLADLLGSYQQQVFGSSKKDEISEECLQCEVYSLCFGDCPKHRFAKSEHDSKPLSYLCPAYSKIFKEMVPYLDVMGRLFRSGRSVSEIMVMKRAQNKGVAELPRRNSSCPCGSGQKYKRCCGRGMQEHQIPTGE